MTRGILFRVAAFAALLSTAGCMATGRTYSATADARVRVGNASYSVWFERDVATMVVQPDAATAIGAGVIDGLTFGAASVREDRAEIYTTAARAVVSEFGCDALFASPVNNASWRVRYRCPDGRVISRELVEANRSRWRAGIDADTPHEIHEPNPEPARPVSK